MSRLVIPLDVKKAVQVVEMLSATVEIRPDFAFLNMKEALDQIDQSDFANANRSALDLITKLLNEFECSLRDESTCTRPRNEIVKELQGKCSRLRRKAESFVIVPTIAEQR